MNVTLSNKRIRGALRAVEYAPLVHRYLIGHVLTEQHEPPELYNYSDAIVTTMDCLNELRTPKKTYHLDCKDSFTTCELVLPIAAALGLNCEILLQQNFPEDPVVDLFKALKVHGIRHEFISGTRMRMWGKLTAGTFIIPAEAGEGFLSGLLFALPLLEENSVVMVNGVLRDMEKIALTLRVLQDAGIQCDTQIAETKAGNDWNIAQNKGTFIGATFKIPGKQRYQLNALPEMEGDWSLASFFLTAGAICGGPVTISGLQLDSYQSARAILPILMQAGALVEYGILQPDHGVHYYPLTDQALLEDAYAADYFRVTGCGSDPTDLEQFFQREHLHAFDVEIRSCPELLPVVCLLATAAEGVSCIRGIDRSDLLQLYRVQRLIEIFEHQGILIWENEGNLYVEGYAGMQPLAGGSVDTGMDDRLAMMEGVASCISGAPVRIENAEAVERNYPDFYEDLLRLQVL